MGHFVFQKKIGYLLFYTNINSLIRIPIKVITPRGLLKKRGASLQNQMGLPSYTAAHSNDS
jgi:hypothetical protein